MVVSPPYPCQLVLEAKLTAVLKAESAVLAGNFCGFSQSGERCWRRQRDKKSNRYDGAHPLRRSSQSQSAKTPQVSARTPTRSIKKNKSAIADPIAKETLTMVS